VSFAHLAPVLLVHPLEKSCLVNQYAPAAAPDAPVKAVCGSVKDEVAKSTDGRPSMMRGPLGCRDKSFDLGGSGHVFLQQVTFGAVLPLVGVQNSPLENLNNLVIRITRMDGFIHFF
jgi:hypothetical protein